MMQNDPSAPLPAEQKERTPVYTFARGVAAVVVHVLFPVRYHGLEHFDLRAPYILMCNHQSLLDPFAVAYPCKDYEVRFLGKKEICKTKLVAWFADKLHMIQVDRHNTDLNAMRQCVKALRNNQVLGIFPEGTRHHDDLMSTIETGTAVLALRANVPLLPMYMDKKMRLFRPVNIYVGQPMDISDLCAQGMDAQVVEALTGRIRDTYLTMRTETQKALPGK